MHPVSNHSPILQALDLAARTSAEIKITDQDKNEAALLKKVAWQHKPNDVGAVQTRMVNYWSVRRKALNTGEHWALKIFDPDGEHRKFNRELRENTGTSEHNSEPSTDVGYSQIRNEKTVNRALAKMRDVGAGFSGMTFRSISALNLEKIEEKNPNFLKENYPHIDNGVPFTSVSKDYSESFAYRVEEPKRDKHPILMHVVGHSGVYQAAYAADTVGQWVLFPSKTPFDVLFKGYDEKNRSYKAVTVEKGTPSSHGQGTKQDLIAPSTPRHIHNLQKLAKSMKAPGAQPADQMQRLSANLAVALRHLPLGQLRNILTRHLDVSSIPSSPSSGFPKRILPSALERRQIRGRLEESFQPLLQKQEFIKIASQHLAPLPKNERHRLLREIQNARHTPHQIPNLLEKRLQELRKERNLNLTQQDCAATVKNITEAMKPLTPQQILTLLKPYWSAMNIAELNLELEDRFKDHKLDLLERQLARMPATEEADDLREVLERHRPVAEETAEKGEVITALEQVFDDDKPAFKKDGDKNTLDVSEQQIAEIAKQLKSTEPRWPAEGVSRRRESVPSPTVFTPNVPGANASLNSQRNDLSSAHFDRRQQNLKRISEGTIYIDAAKANISQDRIQSMLNRERPLVFMNNEQYEQFKNDLKEALKKSKLEDSIVGLQGTGANFYSENLLKRDGWHFDIKGSGSSDVDLNITGESFLNLMKKGFLFSKQTDSLHPDRGMTELYMPHLVRQALPELGRFAEKWRGILGREVTIVGMKERTNKNSADFILSEPFLSSPYRITTDNARKILSGLNKEDREALKKEIGIRPSAKDFIKGMGFAEKAWAQKMQRFFANFGPENRIAASVEIPDFDVYRIVHKGVERKLLLRMAGNEIVEAKPLALADREAIEAKKNAPAPQLPTLDFGSSFGHVFDEPDAQNENDPSKG